MKSYSELESLTTDELVSKAFAWQIDSMLYKSWLKVAEAKVISCEERIGNDCY